MTLRQRVVVVGVVLRFGEAIVDESDRSDVGTVHGQRIDRGGQGSVKTAFSLIALSNFTVLSNALCASIY
ncbi:MAG: hypothetical protein ACI9SE_002067 [Neolewinella sp.]